jgi:hypothetical protein
MSVPPSRHTFLRFTVDLPGCLQLAKLNFIDSSYFAGGPKAIARQLLVKDRRMGLDC